jgi:hypothetical protein
MVWNLSRSRHEAIITVNVARQPQLRRSKGKTRSSTLAQVEQKSAAGCGIVDKLSPVFVTRHLLGGMLTTSDFISRKFTIG